jgi:hypothetical protein
MPIPGGPADPNAPKPSKPLPASAVKLVRDDQEALMTVEGLNTQLGQFSEMIKDGKLNLSTFGNMKNQALNYMGQSNRDSRNLASFQATLEKMRNDSLRLNKGVQTEGDAQRAWNELIANINDEPLVAQRLNEIQQINERAANIRRANIDLVYSNFGATPPTTDSGGTQADPSNGGWSIKKVD